MYTLAMTINYHYWECDCECHYARQAEKEAFKFHSQKQDKAFSTGNAAVSQNKTNTSLVALFAKSSSSKPSPSFAPKKQSNSPWVDLSSKLASNGKLTSDECKKHLENNMYLYCSAEDHKLDSCSKKQTMVTFKGHSASAAASEKPSKNRE